MPNIVHTGKTTWRGIIGGSQSVSCGFTWILTPGDNTTVYPSALEAVNTMASSSDLNGFEQQWLSDMTHYFSTNLVWHSVLYTCYGTDPTTPAEAMRAVNFTGTGAINVPSEVAVVVSHRTALNSSSGRGRTYLPLQGITLSATTGNLDNTIAADIALRTAAYMNSWGQHEFQPSGSLPDTFYTKPAVLSVTHGLANNTTAIRVDTRLDVQRRRENKGSYSYYQDSITN